MQTGLAALKFLTIGGHFDSVPIDPQQLGKEAPYFPLVGLILGVVLALLNRMLEPYLESEILGVVLITLLILMTGATHLKGTQQTFDNLSAENRFKSGAPKPIGFYGSLALLLIVLLKVRSVEVIGETRNLSLLLTPVFARWSLVVFLYGCASTTDETAATIAENVRAWHLLVTTAATL
jgi:adenosylcobinamide-GDP ribazoletransferase